MRLSEKEISNIVTALGFFITSELNEQTGQNEQAELRLYGSRVDDKAKGGDIDLLLIVTTQEFVAKLIYNKPEILVAIKKLLGERRIDLKIATFSAIAEDPFLKIIFPQSILLHKFK